VIATGTSPHINRIYVLTCDSSFADWQMYGVDEEIPEDENRWYA